MSEKRTKPSPKKASASTRSGSHPDLQQAHDDANEKGYFGIATDTTPNEAYTVAGVLKAAKGNR